jgi:hypothetical protein
LPERLKSHPDRLGVNLTKAFGEPAELPLVGTALRGTVQFFNRFANIVWQWNTGTLTLAEFSQLHAQVAHCQRLTFSMAFAGFLQL